MFCRDVRDGGFDDDYVKGRSGFLPTYTKNLARVVSPDYYVKKDMVKEFCSVGVDDNVDTSVINMSDNPIIITFNLSEGRSAEVLVVKHWWCEFYSINAYCRVINDTLSTENFFNMIIKDMSGLRFNIHKHLHILTREQMDIWKVIIHSIMSDIDLLFEELDGVLVSKSVEMSSLKVFEQYVVGHFKRVRYGKERKKVKSKYVSGYWRSNGS